MCLICILNTQLGLEILRLDDVVAGALSKMSEMEAQEKANHDDVLQRLGAQPPAVYSYYRYRYIYIWPFVNAHYTLYI